MPLQYAVIDSGSLGTLRFGKNIETITEQVRAGRNIRNRPVSEVYTLLTDKGSFTVTTPARGALKGEFFEKEIHLINPRIVIQPVATVDRLTGEAGARPRLILEADKIELVEGQK